MHNVLLLIDNDIAAVNEFQRLAELIARTPGMKPVMFIDETMYFAVHKGVPAFCESHGIELLTAADFTLGDGAAALGRQGSSFRRWLARFVVETLPKLLPQRIVRRLAPVDYDLTRTIHGIMLRRAALCRAVFSQQKYTALVIPEDNVELDTSVWIAIARRHGVRTIILPYTMSNTAEFAESYVRHPPFQVTASPENKLVARLFPRWTLRYKGRHFLRSAPARVFSVEMLGLTPPNPWLMNSGDADWIAVESAAMRDYCGRGGHPASKLVITGSQADDVIAEAMRTARQRRSELIAGLGLRDDRPMLVCALPPDQNTFDRPGCEFADFDDLVQFWGECLASIEGWNIVVRPHPKTAPERLQALREKGFNPTYSDTATLIAMCDLYVASASSTIRWAIACGKPVVNYDVYHYNYGDYDGVDGVAFATTRNSFSELLRSVTTDGNLRTKMAASQQRVSGRWGTLDGQSGQRILALLRGEVVAAPKAVARPNESRTVAGNTIAA